MKNKLAAIATLLLSFNTFAATTLDGIWSCQLQEKGSTGITQNYLSIHTHQDGQVIFATLKETANSDYFGYGLGTINGNIYAGSTKYATPFSLTQGADGNLTGTMQGAYNGNRLADLTVKCVKVW